MVHSVVLICTIK
uniref:Uncharacterized protein n=1 Tax=Arundo donax TaxID=35708 RepID=A0A0A9B3C5_ARUDO